MPVISHSSKAFCSQLTSQPLFISAELFEEDTSCLDSLKTHMSKVMIWQLLLLVVIVSQIFNKAELFDRTVSPPNAKT